MKPSTLLAIKQDLRKLSNMYDLLVIMWNGALVHGNNATYPITVQVKVILSNMAMDSSHCYGYNHEEEVRKMDEQLEVLKALNDYNDKCYMTHFPYTEAEMIITGHSMSEDYEDEREYDTQFD